MISMNLVFIDSGNRLWYFRLQAINVTNVDEILIGPMVTDFEFETKLALFS